MDQVNVIRHKVLIEGQSQREVARQLGVSRNTVRKYVAEGMSAPVFRKPTTPRRKPVTEKVLPRFRELIEQWSRRTTRKQRLTAERLHEELVGEGFEVGLTTVRRLFAEHKRLQQEGFVPLVHRPGDSAQVDFFEVTVEVGGNRRKCWMFLMRLMHSGYDFAWLYEHCDQVSFLDGHVRAFAHFGGVPGRCVYDNLKLAVRKFVEGGRELTTRFEALTSHYLFESSFTRRGKGHDKGGVEARGKGVRLQHLVPIPQGENLEQLAAELLQRLSKQAKTKLDRDGLSAFDKFTKESGMLRPLPSMAFEGRQVVLGQASRKALVRIAGAVYSVPSHWRCLKVTAYVGPVDIRFCSRGEVVVKPRVERHRQHVEYRDFLKELSRKPQAVRQVAPELLAELGAPYTELWALLSDTHGGREAGRILARILGAVVKHGEGPVRNGLTSTLQAARDHFEQLSALPEQRVEEVQVPETLKQYQVEAASASDFDALLNQEAAQ